MAYDAAAVQAVVNARGGSSGYIEKVIGTEEETEEETTEEPNGETYNSRLVVNAAMTEEEFNRSGMSGRYGSYNDYVEGLVRSLTDEEKQYAFNGIAEKNGW